MSLSVIAFLAGLSVLASVVSALTGVAGGVVLLSGLLLTVSPLAVVPLHGLVQFSAGLARLVAFRRHVSWSIVGLFIAGMLPGAIVGALALRALKELNQSYVLLVIAVFIVFAILPRRDREMADHPRTINRLGLYALGAGCGVLGMFVGSTGPLVSGWLLRHGIVKEAHIGSKSVMQGSAHLVKIPLFIWGLDFDFSPYLPALALMIPGVIAGTFLGKMLLGKLSPDRFSLIVRTLLILIVVRIVWTEVGTLWAT